MPHQQKGSGVVSMKPVKQGNTSPEMPSPQDSLVWQARHQAQLMMRVLHSNGIAEGSAVLVPCCGRGWQAVALARAGYRVTGVDIRSNAELLRQWQEHEAGQPGLRFVAGDARYLPLRGKFGAVLIFGNNLSVFSANDDAIAVLRGLRRLIASDGLMLIGNVCQEIWEEIAAGRYANGLSEDGLWQMIWQRARNVFALRYGDQVRATRTRIGAGEPVYRAWSLDEVDLLCRLTGWRLAMPERRQAILTVRPAFQMVSR